MSDWIEIVRSKADEPCLERMRGSPKKIKAAFAACRRALTMADRIALRMERDLAQIRAQVGESPSGRSSTMQDALAAIKGARTAMAKAEEKEATSDD